MSDRQDGIYMIASLVKERDLRFVLHSDVFHCQIGSQYYFQKGCGSKENLNRGF